MKAETLHKISWSVNVVSSKSDEYLRKEITRRRQRR